MTMITREDLIAAQNDVEDAVNTLNAVTAKSAKLGVLVEIEVEDIDYIGGVVVSLVTSRQSVDMRSAYFDEGEGVGP